MITFRASTEKFSKALRDLQDHAGVSTGKLLRNEARLLAEELAKKFSPKMPRAKKGIEIERKMAYRTGKRGLAQIPWTRLQRIIARTKPADRKPMVQASVAMPSQRKGIKALGTLAAGFIGRGNKLAAKARSFVMAHTGESHGDVTIRDGALSKWIRLRNFTPWLNEIRGRHFLVKRALNARTGAMRANLKRLKQGIGQYWGKGK